MQQEIINGYRLSSQQTRLWALQQDATALHTQLALLLNGDLNIAALKKALQRVVNRHEILRTTFQQVSGMQLPIQVVSEGIQARLPELEVDTLADESQIDRLLGDAQKFAPDTLEELPLQISLHKIDESSHMLVMNLPSLCADTWSMKNLTHEISQAYEEEVFQRHTVGDDNDDEVLQYVQFSEWQYELLEDDDEDAVAGDTFWQQQNLATVAAPHFTFERNINPDDIFTPRTLQVPLEASLITELHVLANNLETGPETVLMAVWQSLLWRLTGQADILIGQVCDGRPHEMLQEALGLYAKWLPIHGHFEPDTSYKDIVAQLHEMREQIYEWQDYFIWEKHLKSDLNIEPHFFHIGFEFAEGPATYQANGVSFSVYKQWALSGRFSLKLTCYKHGSSLNIEIQYDENRFHAEDVARLVGCFSVLLQNAVSNPDTAVSQLSVLSDSDRMQIQDGFNQTAIDYAHNVCLHTLFEAQVDKTPDSLAIVFGDEQLTFAELNARANQLAYHLQGLGVGPDTSVGLCLERSVQMMVGLLGILKAGGAYVPLDPMYPKDRLAYTLADAAQGPSGADPILLTQSTLQPNLPDTGVQVIALDADWETIAQQPADNPAVAVGPENLAYVIYTSGSTGKPKGVMVQHESVVNLVAGLQNAIYDDLPTPLKISLNAPLTFDSSVKQWVQLLQGHTLYIVPDEIRPDGQALLAFVAQHQLEVLDCTPAQLQLLLAAVEAEGSAWLPKAVLVGGEAISDAVWSALPSNPNLQFYNVYGPTECTVDATICAIQPANDRPTIGQPIVNTQIYILDQHLSPVPIGTPGELYIAGEGVSRGYLNQPALTAAKFTPNPFGHHPGMRMYKTGDLAYFNADGSITFLGRADHQVKLRGYRIELGEIERVLTTHDTVRESVVIVHEAALGNQRLVAYVVPQQKGQRNTNDLRVFLRDKLPEYMIPATFVLLNELPLTRNGKIDRQALPDPSNVRPELSAAFVAPRSQFEQQIADVWQTVLQVDKVGVDDNFFDLGGHSLLLVKVHTELRNAFDKEISLIDLFRNPTVGMLAQYFSEDNAEKPSLQRAHDRAAKRKGSQERRRKRTRISRRK